MACVIGPLSPPPPGTVVVKPEPVGNEAKDDFRGPEFRSRGAGKLKSDSTRKRGGWCHFLIAKLQLQLQHNVEPMCSSVCGRGPSHCWVSSHLTRLLQLLVLIIAQLIVVEQGKN